MSCNGCRVLRKGCSDDCMLRHCLLWIENPQAQAHATVFVAKFFGRAALMSSLSSVPTNQRSALFQSLLYEAVGRTINPVNGAVGLLWTGNWHLCQWGVEKVLRGGGELSPLPQFLGGAESEGFGSIVDCSRHQQVMGSGSRMLQLKRKVAAGFEDLENFQAQPDLEERVVVGGGRCYQAKKQRAATPSEESETTTLGSSTVDCVSESQKKLLTLFF